MKITELDFTKEGKKYRCGKIIFEIKDGDLINIESSAYLRDANISMAELSKMDFEEIKETKSPYKQVEHGDRYYSIYGHTVLLNTDSNDGLDNIMFSAANYFNNKEYAEYIAFKENLMRRMDRFAWENNETAINWTDNSIKYCIEFNYKHNELAVVWASEYKSSNVYFTSGKIANKAIEEFKEDLIKLYTWKFDS